MSLASQGLPYSPWLYKRDETVDLVCCSQSLRVNNLLIVLINRRVKVFDYFEMQREMILQFFIS